MDFMTLDYSRSYRAITDADIQLVLARNYLGYNGDGIPTQPVLLIDDLGNETTLPGGPVYPNLTPFQLEHNPRSDHLDLVSDSSSPGYYLRFQMAVNPPPIWENYVEATYVGNGAISQYGSDFGDFISELFDYQEVLRTYAFRATEATLGDGGGILADYSSTISLLLEDIAYGWQDYPLNIVGSAFGDRFRGGPQADTLLGFGGVDVLKGSGGRDDLQGLSNDDFLYGGADKDTLYGGDGLDLLDGGGANDRLYGDGDSDELFGGDGADSLFGGEEHDKLNGEEKNDVLSGDTGDDILKGGPGKDKMTGGKGIDWFVFDHVGVANADRIMDFEHGLDFIGLSRRVFGGVHLTVDAGELRLGTAALDGDDRIIYNQATGQLFYDPDGTRHGEGSAPQVLFATLVNRAALTYQDFIVI